MFQKKLEYECDGVLFESSIYNRESHERRPIVMIAHAWAGKDPFSEMIAQKVAELGYVGCAMDVYGKGVRGTSTEEKLALMNPLVENRPLLRKRLSAAYENVAELPYSMASHCVVLGYCFGGLCALEMHRCISQLKGVVSVHGLLGVPKDGSLFQPQEDETRSRVLALHGADDPMVSSQDMLDFTREMNENRVDWQLYQYGRVKHAFTNPDADDHVLGTVYNKLADQRSWRAITNFLEECFSRSE